jgi:hypothetical protein
MSEPGQDYGVKWLVEERDRLKARVAVLENELVRRDAAPPTPPEAFFVEVDPLSVQTMTYSGQTQMAVADQLVGHLAREIVRRSLHRLSAMPDGSIRLYFLGNKTLKVDSLGFR